LLSNASVA